MRSRFFPTFKAALQSGAGFGMFIVLLQEYMQHNMLKEQFNQVTLNDDKYIFKTDQKNYGIQSPLRTSGINHYIALRSALIVKQSFDDCGVKAPIHFNVFFKNGTTDPNMSIITCYDEKFRKRIILQLELPIPLEEQEKKHTILKYTMFDGELYAIGGHEAMHHVHRHPQLREYIKGFIFGMAIASKFKISPKFIINLMGFACQILLKFSYVDDLTGYIHNPLTRLTEIDADVSSTRTLGTTQIFVQSLGKYAKEFENKPYVAQTHPHPLTRIKLIKAFASQNSSPLLFNGKRRDEISASALQMILNKPEAENTHTSIRNNK